MAVLSRHVVQKIKDLVVNAERLEVMKEKVRQISRHFLTNTLNYSIQLKRDWVNFFLGQSCRISDYHARYLLSERQWTIEESLPEIPCEPSEFS